MAGLKEMPKVGDKVKCNVDDFNSDVTEGCVYIINEVDEWGDALFIDDSGSSSSRSFISVQALGSFELVTEPQPQPDVTELLANLGRRLLEVEEAIAPKDCGLSSSYPKYFKDVSDIVSIDVYKAHELFGIDDPSGAIQHASKKLLLSGARTGGKSKFTDIKEARDTLSRWLEINAMEARSAE